MTKNVTVNKELVNKLSNIIKQYDPYTAYIDDYQQYSNAVDINCELDQQFIHTCKEYGYDVGVSFCYSLAKSLASGKFDSAEDCIIYYINSLTKEDDSILSSPNTTPENKEEIAMKKNTNINNTTVTNNSATEVKEEFTMKELVKRITENKIHDKGYIDRPTLKTIMNEQFGFNFSNRSTRTEMVEALMNKYKDSLKVADENTAEDNNISIEDSNITHDNAPESIEESTITVENPATVYDAKALTYMLMHKIGDHAIANRKKGFGTTISAKILCAFIVEISSLNDIEPIDRLYVPTGKKDKYGKDITIINPKITEEHKNKCKDVRNWLLNNGYIKPVTFKDEKGFTFYTPEYDGNRKDKMYDCTKFRATGKVETTTYMVTKKMNKWYV